MTHPKLILHEVDNVLMKFIHERPSLFLAQVFETSLENATAIRMGGQNVYLASESVNNELNVLSRHTFDSLLDNMVPILILDALKNISL